MYMYMAQIYTLVAVWVCHLATDSGFYSCCGVHGAAKGMKDPKVTKDKKNSRTTCTSSFGML